MKVCAPPIRSGPNTGVSATGTRAGYDRHRAAREPACEACLSYVRVSLREPTRARRLKNQKPRTRATQGPEPAMSGTPAHRATQPAVVGSVLVRCATCGRRGQANSKVTRAGRIERCAECR